MHAAKQDCIGGELDRSRLSGYCKRKRQLECDRYYEKRQPFVFHQTVCVVVDCTFVR